MNTKKNVKANTTAKSTGAEKKSETKALLTVVKNLKAVLPSIKDTKLSAKVTKALNSKTATADSLQKLLDEVIKSGMPKKAVVENEVKAKKTIKKSTPKEEPEKVTKTAKETKPTAKTTSKASTKKTTEKKEDKSPVESVKSTGDYFAPSATRFPDEITTMIDEEKVTLRKAEDDEFTSIEEILEAIENDTIIVFACYWSPRHIKQQHYAASFDVFDKLVPKRFENDLDLVQAVTVATQNRKILGMSVYTEAFYAIFEEELTAIEDVNPYNGEKYTVRLTAGTEFAIYVAD